MVYLEYENRNCDCCGNEELETVWVYEKTASTKSSTYSWTVRNVICPHCGFTFVSPCPSQECLIEYYSSSYQYWEGQSLDYNIDSRLALLRKNTAEMFDRRKHFVEVGGNVSGEFQEALSSLFNTYTNVEVNKSCGTVNRSLSDLPEKSADVLAAYFVLEHVPVPRGFLKDCARVVKDDGVLVLEVPNIYTYPTDPAALSWWEHTNHFSPLTLCSLAAAEGFCLREISYDLCSRSFGFAAVFAKAYQSNYQEAKKDSLVGHCEYHLAKACMTGGMKRISKYRDQLESVRNKIREVCDDGGKVAIWAANQVCVDLLESFELPASAVIIDSNPEKHGYLRIVPVYEPAAMKRFIIDANLFVINTGLFHEEIIQFVRNDFGRQLRRDEVIVVNKIGSGA